jgi:hypothetical protein
MAAPVYQAESTNVNSTATTTCNLAKPGGAADGEIWVCFIDRAARTTTITPPVSGTNNWAQFVVQDYSGGSLTGFWKYVPTVSAEPGSFLFTWTSTSRNCGFIARISGAHTTDPIAASPIVDAGNTTSIDFAASGALDLGDYLAITIVGQEGKGADRLSSWDASYTEDRDLGTTGTGGAGAHCGLGWANAGFTSITSEDPTAVTSSVNDYAVGVTLMIRAPAADAALFPPFRRNRLTTVRM